MNRVALMIVNELWVAHEKCARDWFLQSGAAFGDSFEKCLVGWVELVADGGTLNCEHCHKLLTEEPG